MDQRACPVAFIVATAFTSGLVWLIALLNQLPTH
jgi:hypothetical protein